MEATKKEEILKACFSEFAQYGYEKANTNRICEMAGVSKGLLFHYFGSKKGLYLDCVEECIAGFIKIFENFSVKNFDFISSLIAYGRKKIEYYAEHPLHYRIMLNAFLNTPEDVTEQLSKRYQDLYVYSMNVMDELVGKLDLKPGVKPEQAITLITAVAGVIEKKYTPVVLEKQECTQEMYRAIESDYISLIKLLLYGIAQPPPQEPAI